MSTGYPKLVAIAMSAVGLVTGLYFLWQIQRIDAGMERLPAATAQTEASTVGKSKHKDRSPNGFPALVTMDDILTDVRSDDTSRLHTVNLRIEIELFDEDSRSSIERAEAGLKNVIIETIRQQSLAQLNSLSGKLYFKELLVSRMNTFLNQPTVRDLHFASFFLQ